MRITATLFFCLALAAGPSIAENQTRFVFTATRAVVIGEPELVSTGSVRHFDWSPDGKYLVAVRNAVDVRNPEEREFSSVLPDARGETSIVVFDAVRRRSTVVWRRPDPKANLTAIAWFNGTQSALLAILEHDLPGPVLIRVDASRATSTVVGRMPGYVQLVPCASRPVIAVSTLQHSATALALVSPTGAARQVELPPGEGYPMFRWSADGAALFVHRIEPTKTDVKRLTPMWHRVESASGSVTRVDNPPPAPVAVQPKLPYDLQYRPVQTELNGSKANLKPLWLEATDETPYRQALICADAGQAEIAPDGSGIAYLAGDSVWFVPLVLQPQEAMNAILEARAARACRANMAAIAAAQAAFAIRYGTFAANPNADFNASDPSSGGVVGAPEGLASRVACPSGADYSFTATGDSFTLKCPHAASHAKRIGRLEDYSRTLQR